MGARRWEREERTYPDHFSAITKTVGGELDAAKTCQFETEIVNVWFWSRHIPKRRLAGPRWPPDLGDLTSLDAPLPASVMVQDRAQDGIKIGDPCGDECPLVLLKV